LTSEATDIFLSLEMKYLEKIVRGEKTVELRRRPLRVPGNARIWLYAKSPTAKVFAFATVHEITVGAPSVLWKKFQDSVGISKEDFSIYFSGRDIGCAISLRFVTQLRHPVTLLELREKLGHFHPPQFAKYLTTHSPERKLLRQQAVM
jgi:predicted transcriptional regulator